MTQVSALLYWSCPKCARQYGTDVEKCVSRGCTDIPSRADQERFLFDTYRKAGVLDEALALAEALKLPDGFHGSFVRHEAASALFSKVTKKA